MKPSLLTNRQVQSHVKVFERSGRKYRITVELRYDDLCHNGHNTFGITADIHEMRGGGWRWDSGGCLHDEIREHVPEFASLIKWHLCSSDGPLHYVANTVYFAGNRDRSSAKARELASARVSAIWPDATDEELTAPGLEDRLQARLPALLEEFQTAMETVGFVF